MLADTFSNAATLRAFAALALVTTLSGAASAQPSEPSAADRLFRDARALMKNGNFKAACPKLVESQRLDPAPGTAVNLADCWEKSGKLGDAVGALRTALGLFPAGDARIPLAKEQLASLERRAARLTLKLGTGTPAGSTIRNDGTVVEESGIGVALPTNSGAHVIELSAPDGTKRQWRVMLRDGEQRDVVLDAGGNAASGEATQRSDASSGSTQRTLGYVAGGIGIAGVLFGGWQYFRFSSKSSDYKDVCAGREDSCPSRERERASTLKDEADSAGRLSAIGLVGGGLALGAGIVLVTTAKDERASAASWRFVPTVARAGLGVSAGATW